MSRCPSCAAHNPEGADWCSQCYTRLGVPPEPPRVPVATPDPNSALAQPGPTAELTASTDAGRFRRTAEGLDWECQVCQEWNPIELTICRMCQTPFVRSAAVHAKDTLPKPVDENVALIASMVLPGAGHYLMGYVASGISRAVVYLFCMAGGLLLLRSAAVAGASLAPAMPLLIGGLVILVLTVFDTLLAMSKRADQELLRGRRFFWLVIGILGALMLSFAVNTAKIGLDPGGSSGGSNGGSSGGVTGEPTTTGTIVVPSTDGTATDGAATDGSATDGSDGTATDGAVTAG